MRTPWRDLALVVVAPVMVVGLGLGLWRDAQGAEARAAAAQARLAHALSRPAPAPEAEATALLLPGETAGLAASAFQALVRAQVQGTGAEVAEVAAGAAEAAAPLTRLHLTLTLTGSETGIAAALVALEGAVPLIAVDRLDMQGGDGRLTATLALSAWTGKVVP